jgi:hypothetical protein
MNNRLSDISVYISSSMTDKAAVKQFADKLSLHQIRVTSTWHDDGAHDWKPGDAESARSVAKKCLTEILEADWFVQFSESPSTLGGMHYEMGFAVGLRKLIILIGKPVMPFQYLPCVKYCKTFDEFMFGLMAARVRHEMSKGKGGPPFGRPRR